MAGFEDYEAYDGHITCYRQSLKAGIDLDT